ncbi:MAG: zinc-ribbon domain-containing protein [Ruminococcaceae bacterium]|nr:zinc-ribbon domain-containing protein [Oscillospiraceae bacterium]
MICYNCGKKLDTDDKFCPDCGTENIVTEEELAIDEEILKNTKKEKKPLKDPKKTAIVALVLAGAAIQLPIVVGVAFAIIALVFARRVRKESDDSVVLKLAKIAKILSIAALVWSCVATVLAVLAIIAAILMTVFYTVLWVLAVIVLVFTDLGDTLLNFFGTLI